VLLRTSCFNRGLAFMEVALCMDIWVDSDFGSQVRIGKEAANVRGCNGFGINVFLVYDL
jgi:hypothetical protein